MTSTQKLIDKFKNNAGSLSVKEILRIGESEGFILEQGKGSHFKLKKGKDFFVFPIHSGDCQLIYKKKFHKYLFHKN